LVSSTPISVRKCCCIVLGNADALNTVYNIGDQPIDRVSEVRDLGIIVDSTLSLRRTVALAHQQYSRKSKWSRSSYSQVFCVAFKVYVRPMLEYAVCVCVCVCGRHAITTQ